MNIAAIYTLFHVLWTIHAIFLPDTAHALPNISQFEVRALPDSASLPPSWAGRLPVPETEDGNAIFFWLFQAEDPVYDDNLIIWFNGGPGCSSLIGLTTGNGPVSFSGNSKRLVQNPHSWTKLGHVLYVDQPVGTGYSTASIPYPVQNNDRVASDFSKWLRSFFITFPHLQSKRVHLIGESYAGVYIPYFASEIVKHNEHSSPHIDLQSMAIGDGTIGNPAAMSTATIGTFLESHRETLHIPHDIIDIFAEADEVCGFGDVLNQANHYPPSQDAIHIPGNPEYLNYRRQRRDLDTIIDETCSLDRPTAHAVATSIFNSTCYGPCATFSTAKDYLAAVAAGRKCFDVYDILNDCDIVDPLPLLASYFSRPDMHVALNLPPPSARPTTDNHIDTSAHDKAEKHQKGGYEEEEEEEEEYAFNPCNATILQTLLFAPPPVPPTYSLLPTLITTHNISLHVYSGENDMLLNHIGAELVLQNMTWHGKRGFTSPPNNVFFVQDAAPSPATLLAHPCGRMDGGAGPVEAIAACALDPSVAGFWVADRGVTYHLFRGAGHSVFVKKPREMFSYVRDVVLAG